MVYFVRVGVIPPNKSGIGARGWFIERSGSNVTVGWGALKVVPARTNKFRWAYASLPQRRQYPFLSVFDAEHFKAKKIKEKTRPDAVKGGYRQLPNGLKIGR
jgi:hypothetical protein